MLFHCSKLTYFELELSCSRSWARNRKLARSSRCFATAGRLCTASRLSSTSATAVTAVVVLAEQLAEHAAELATARGRVAARISNFATARWSCTSARSGLATTAGSRKFRNRKSGSQPVSQQLVVSREKLLEQAALWLAATGVTARIHNFATAGGAARCSQPQVAHSKRCFAATSGLDVTTAVTSFVTQFVKQAKRASVDRARSNHCDCQKSRNDYTTHRDISMDLGFGKVLPRLSRNTSERPKTFSKLCLDPTTNVSKVRLEGLQVDRRVAARAANTCSQVFTTCYRRMCLPECE